MLMSLLLAAADAKIVDLKDGFVRVETPVYTMEVPKGWAVSRETNFGQRKAKAPNGKGELGMMTGGQTDASWDSLYRTSLYFIMREERGKATPYQITKTKQGYDAATFSVVDEDGFASRRYVLLKDANGALLALSVRIGDRKQEKELVGAFDRMVRSTRIL
jgi:hypothetical protein